MSALDGRAAVERCLERLRAGGAHAGDVCFAESDTLEARVRDTEIDFVKQARERTLGIRAFVAGSGGLQSALTSTSDLGAETLDAMVAETLALARATAPDPAAGLPGGGYAEEIPELGLFDPADREVDAETRIRDAHRAEEAARAFDPRIDNSEGSQVDSASARWVYGNTDGFLGEYLSASHGLFSEPVARQGETMQRDWAVSVGRRLADLDDAETVGRLAAERAVGRLGARQSATCAVPVIFEPRTARSLVGHIASCVNGSAVYREASCYAGRLGERVAAGPVTVIDDGRLQGGLGSRPFDGEGQPTRRTAVIEGGVLGSYLLDSYAARKLGGESTGNASRSAAGGPGPGVTNLWLEPGTATREEIIGDTPSGLYVTELIGMGFNAVTGDYSRGAAGFWIENGELTYPVEEVTIAGRLDDMLAGIDAVGSDLEWLGSVAAPTLRIREMTVAGSS